MTGGIKRNLLFTIMTQAVVVAVGLIKTLLLPNAFATVEDYGYWQVFMFYSSYLLIFTFGYHEGVYLMYGGKDFGTLPDKDLKRSFTFHLLLMLFITIVVTSLLYFLLPNGGYKKFVYIMVMLKLPASAIIEFYSRVFQGTNEFKLYYIYTIIDKVLFVVLMIGLIVFKQKYYREFIIAEFLTQNSFHNKLMIFRSKQLSG